MTLLKLTPTLLVDEIEPVLAFWTDVLGFNRLTEVPGDDGRLVFAMLTLDAVELHLQTRRSCERDLPYLATSQLPPSGFLYIDVDDVRSLHDRIRDRAEVIVPLEKTFYGATHFFVRDPAGHVVGFSQNG
jgi:uncharacterized glyoxalase superfamily protein PhnB